MRRCLSSCCNVLNAVQANKKNIYTFCSENALDHSFWPLEERECTSWRHLSLCCNVLDVIEAKANICSIIAQDYLLKKYINISQVIDTMFQTSLLLLTVILVTVSKA